MIGAAVLLGATFGCSEPPPTPSPVDAGARPDAAFDAVVDAAPDATVDATVDAAPDLPPVITTFHGVPVRAWDRTMPDVDAIGYEVDLRVDEATAGAETFAGELRGVFVATRPLDALALDYTGDDVDATEVDGQVARATRAGGVLTIPLGRTVPEGSAFNVTVRYHGRLFQGTGADANDFEVFGGLMAFQRNRAGRKIYESLNWPSKARRWLPVRDHPRDGVMVAMRATFPQRYTVLSNGRAEGTADNADGTRTSRFFCATAMPPYDIHVAAYDDWAETMATSAGGRVVRWLPYATDREMGMTLLQELPAAMDFYENTFGPFRWEQAVFVEVPIFGGGMEHATLVSMDESLFRAAARNRSVSFHELGHHWSGNLVRLGAWNDFWLSEGMTDYLTGRFLAEHDGADAGMRTWRSYLNQGLGVDRAATHHPLRPADPEVNPLSIFDAITYKKGAFVLRMLERRLGAEAFTAFLRGWFERHAERAVTTRDLDDDLDAAFPGRDVHGFFRQWVFGEGHPELQTTTRYDAAARRVSVTLRQLQERGPADGFTFPVAVELSRGDARERVTVDVTGRTTTQDFPLAFDPDGALVDPDEELFAVASCEGASACRAGYTCGVFGASPGRVCVPPRAP